METLHWEIGNVRSKAVSIVASPSLLAAGATYRKLSRVAESLIDAVDRLIMQEALGGRYNAPCPTITP